MMRMKSNYRWVQVLMVQLRLTDFGLANLKMSEQQASLDTISRDNSVDSSLNQAHLLSVSDLQSTPPTRKSFPNTKTKMKVLEDESDSTDQEWKMLLTKSIQIPEDSTPGNKGGKSAAKHQKTAQMKLKLSGKFQRCCPICLGEYHNIRGSLQCLHQFCFQCIQKWAESSTICPCCRSQFSSILKMARDTPNGHVKQTERIQVQKKELAFESEYDHYVCYECGSGEDQHVLLICDECDFYCCHVYCDAALNNRIPTGEWFCIYCRQRRRRRRRPGFMSISQLDLANNHGRISDFVPSQENSQKGVSSRTRSHEIFQPTVSRSSIPLLRNLRRGVR